MFKQLGIGLGFSFALIIVIAILSSIVNPKPVIDSSIPESGNYENVKTITNNMDLQSKNKHNINIRQLELDIHNLINTERQNVGLSLLIWDETIAKIARVHSQDMAERNYFSHDSPEGITPIDRGISAGYTKCGIVDAISLSDQLDKMEQDLSLAKIKLSSEQIDYQKQLQEYQLSGRESQYDLLEQNRLQLNSRVDQFNQKTEYYNDLVMELNQMGMDGKFGQGFAENIFKDSLYSSTTTMNGIPVSRDWNTQEELAISAVSGWMESEGHRDNIMGFHHSQGIGVSISGDDVLITQDFC